jgi:hypothetical protein
MIDTDKYVKIGEHWYDAIQIQEHILAPRQILPVVFDEEPVEPEE